MNHDDKQDALATKKCLPCEGGVPPLSRAECERLLSQLSSEWRLSPDGTELQRELVFKDFFRTMSFVNALAHVANAGGCPQKVLAAGWKWLRWITLSWNLALRSCRVRSWILTWL